MDGSQGFHLLHFPPDEFYYMVFTLLESRKLHTMIKRKAKHTEEKTKLITVQNLS